MGHEGEHEYRNFDLAFDREDDGYVVRVLSSPAGQASEPFVMPFSADQVENFTLKVAAGRPGLRSFGATGDGLAREFGGALHEAVFNGDVATCLRRSLDAAARDEVGLRIRLRLSDAPELTTIPWEYLYSRATGKFLGLSAHTPLVRYADLDEPTDVLTVRSPLRILLLTSAPAGTDALDIEREVELLERATESLVDDGQVEVHRLESGTLRGLQRELRRDDYHVLHYIGHGVFDAGRDRGLLALEDADGQLDAVSGQKLGQVLTDHRSLRMAVLNACEGGRASVDQPLGGVAQALVRQGLPAVVAMQFVISDVAAVTFSSELYAAIGDGFPIDAAVAEARKSVYIESKGVEWGTPALHLRADDGRIFAIDAGPVAPPAALPMVAAAEAAPDPQPQPDPPVASEAASPEPVLSGDDGLAPPSAPDSDHPPTSESGLSANDWQESPPSGRKSRVPAGIAAALVLVVLGLGAWWLSPIRSDPGSPAPDLAASPTPTPTPTSSPATSPDWVDTFATVQSGVARLDLQACDGTQGTGSGFLVEEDLVVTAAHVVSQAEGFRVQVAGDTVEGGVIGLDETHDLALVRLDREVTGHQFGFDPRPLVIGEEVAAAGYPLTGELSLTPGTVTAVDLAVAVDAAEVSGVLRTDAAVNPGNSGGALLREDGTVAGVVFAKNVDVDVEGVGYALSAEIAAPKIRTWAQANRAVDISCPEILAEATEAEALSGSEGEPGDAFDGSIGLAPVPSWIVVLDSLDVKKFNRQDAVDRMLDYEASLGVVTYVLLSDGYGSLNPGYWVVAVGAFELEDDAAEYCRTIRSTIDVVESCYQRRLDY